MGGYLNLNLRISSMSQDLQDQMFGKRAGRFVLGFLVWSETTLFTLFTQVMGVVHEYVLVRT